VTTITTTPTSISIPDRLPRPRHLISALRVLLTVAMVAAAVAMLLPGLLGLQRYVIVGSSMEPTIPKGSIVYERPVPIADLAVGDVITFVPPRRFGIDHPVTHRIAAVTETEGVGRTFVTKGDANAVADPWEFTFEEGVQPRVAFHVPYLGHLFSALQQRTVRILAIGIPAAVIGLMVLRQILGELRADRQVRRTTTTITGA
jgi:signal peptidase I